MAWIVKDSAHELIDRQAEPYLTDKLKAKFEKQLIPRYPTRQASLLPIAHEIQHEHGYLPHQALEELAQFLGLSFAEVLDAVTFYEEFSLKPLGKYLIQVCRSISCELCGCRSLSRSVSKKLGVLPGETTDDGKFTYQELECLGACDFAPVALVDHKLRKNLSWKELEAVLDSLED